MSIEHHVVGSGPRTVFLTHGWFGSSDGWGPFVEYLDTDAFRWVFTDVRGYGGRMDVEGDQSLGETARDVLALADELGVDRFTIVGHSMGGAAAQKVLALAPDRVEAIVAITPVGSMPTPFDDEGRALFWGAPEHRENRIGIIDLLTGHRNTPRFLSSIADWSLGHSTVAAYAGALEAWANPDFADDVRGQELPVLVAVGEHDPALGAETVKETWLPLFPNARLEVIHNAGHFPMFEAPVNLATVVDAFLKSLPAAD